MQIYSKHRQIKNICLETYQKLYHNFWVNLVLIGELLYLVTEVVNLAPYCIIL